MRVLAVSLVGVLSTTTAGAGLRGGGSSLMTPLLRNAALLYPFADPQTDPIIYDPQGGTVDFVTVVGVGDGYPFALLSPVLNGDMN